MAHLKAPPSRLVHHHGCPILAPLGWDTTPPHQGMAVYDFLSPGPHMPTGLRRFQQTRQMHFVTFSCYRRQPKLGTPHARNIFEQSLEGTQHAQDSV